MFQLRYYKMVQSLGMKKIQKLQEFKQLQRSSGKSRKFDGLLSKKIWCAFVQKKHSVS